FYSKLELALSLSPGSLRVDAGRCLRPPRSDRSARLHRLHGDLPSGGHPWHLPSPHSASSAKVRSLAKDSDTQHLSSRNLRGSPPNASASRCNTCRGKLTCDESRI